MAKPRAPQMSMKDKIINASLKLAADGDWDAVTMARIAKASKVSLSDLSDHFEDKADILNAYFRRVDKKALENAGEEGVPARDRLFETLMERFDVMNEDREGVVPIIRSICRDPRQAAISFCAVGRSMAWMLERAAIETAGLGGAARIIGTGAVYIKTLLVWCDDESPDMAKTMAALDKNLDMADKITQTLGLSSGNE